ncbi:MAG TPA: DUF2079 domain-containing protein [Ktedonobacterales bacterium]|nr:DUF2079 domain-containing protein [Ktedonobacterales bacterium]
MSRPSEMAETSAQSAPPSARPNSKTPITADLRARARILWQTVQTPEGQRRLAWMLTLLAVALDILIVGQHTLARYHNYDTSAFDLGNMNQAVWNTLHGDPFRFTNRGLDWNGPPTRLALHVEPILLLIAPFYLIHDGPETLIVIQVVAMALGSIPLLMLGLRHLSQIPLLAVGFVVAYLLTPEYLGAVLWDFHTVALATPLLLLALWALDAEHVIWFAVAAVLAALTKEDVALSLVLLGGLLALRGRWRFGLIVTVLSAAYVALCFFVILPHFGGSATNSGNNFWYRYSWLGGSVGAALHNIARNPLLPLSILNGARLGYLASLLRTAGGLGLLSPLLLICALPELAVNILSVHEEQYSGFFHYNAVILAYTMAAAVYGVAALYQARTQVEQGETQPAIRAAPESPAARLRWLVQYVETAWQRFLARIPIPSRWIVPLALAWLLVVGWWNLSVTGGGRIHGFWAAAEHPNSEAASINALLDRIPQSATVAATDSLDPQLSSRRTIFLLPDQQAYQAEYVAADIANAISISRDADRRILDRMLASGRYTLVGRTGDVVVLHRTGPPLAPETP